jgi:alkylation response protein AidB-like acyl-CoA dehydrogenase
MDLNLTTDELAFRDELRVWLASHVPKDWDEWREKPMEESFPYLRDWQRKLQEGRWAAVSWPKEYGGRSATLMQQAIFWEEMARVEAPPMANSLGLGLIGPTIIAYGTEAQKKRYIPKILSAEEIWCQGFSEPNAGSDLAGLQTEARLDGDHYVVNGQKVWTSYGWVGNWCELVVRTDTSATKHKGLTVLLVDMKSPGVEVRPLRQMTGESEFNELFFRDVRVPAENILGKVNDGWNVAMSTLMYERGSYGARLHLIFKRYITRLIELARTTQRDGRPASEDPIIRQKLAQCSAEIEIMRFNQMRLQPHQCNWRSRPGRLHPENFLERAQPAPPANRSGNSRFVRPAHGRRCPRHRQWTLVLCLSANSRKHHRGWHIRSPAQHHRPFRSRSAQKLLVSEAES